MSFKGILIRQRKGNHYEKINYFSVSGFVADNTLQSVLGSGICREQTVHACYRKESCSYGRGLNNRAYVDLIHLIVLGRHASDRETKIGMNYLKKHDRMEYVAMILKQPGTWIEFIDSNSHLSFGNPYDDYVWNR